MQIIKPTESLLRKFFTRFGPILDVQVNWYTTGTPTCPRQEGYAFISFQDVRSLEMALFQPVYQVDGIVLTCTRANGGSNNRPRPL